MPFVHDPEFQKVLEKLREDVLKRNRSFWWASLITCTVILIIASILIDVTELSSNLKFSLIIVACTLCVIAIINSAVTAIHGALTVVVGTVEWVGRKQLGEYDETK